MRGTRIEFFGGAEVRGYGGARSVLLVGIIFQGLVYSRTSYLAPRTSKKPRTSKLSSHLVPRKNLRTPEKQKRIGKNQSFLRASCRIRTNDPEITNHVLWPTELKRRVGKRSISHRYNQVPLLRSRPGGFRGSWSYRTCPCFLLSGCKGTTLN